MKNENPAERPNATPETLQPTPKPKTIEAGLLRFPIPRAANQPADLDDMWDNVPV